MNRALLIILAIGAAIELAASTVFIQHKAQGIFGGPLIFILWFCLPVILAVACGAYSLWRVRTGTSQIFTFLAACGCVYIHLVWTRTVGEGPDGIGWGAMYLVGSFVLLLILIALMIASYLSSKKRGL